MHVPGRTGAAVRPWRHAGSPGLGPRVPTSGRSTASRPIQWRLALTPSSVYAGPSPFMSVPLEYRWLTTMPAWTAPPLRMGDERLSAAVLPVFFCKSQGRYCSPHHKELQYLYLHNLHVQIGQRFSCGVYDPSSGVS